MSRKQERSSQQHQTFGSQNFIVVANPTSLCAVILPPCLGKELFTTPYQYIAADANNTQSVSAIDLVELRKLILGIYSELPNNQSWRFVDKAFPMEADNPWPFSEEIALPGLANDSIMHNDFVGVKIGDVNNSAKANSNQVLPRGARRVLQVEMDALPELKTGEVINVKLRIPEYVEGFQWTLETDGLNFVKNDRDRLDIKQGNIGVPDTVVITMMWHALSVVEDKERGWCLANACPCHIGSLRECECEPIRVTVLHSG